MPTTIDLAPTPPDTARPLTFADDASAFAAWMAAMPPQFNAVVATLMAGESSAALALVLSSNDPDKGATRIGMPSGGTVANAHDGIVSVIQKGADNVGTTEANTAIQAAIAAANGGTLVINPGTYLIGSAGLDFSGFSGYVLCYGTLKAKPGVSVSNLVYFGNAQNIFWLGGNLDFSQTSTQVESDPRSDHGFYMRDARDIKIQGAEFKNIRFGEPIYIDGTSSVSPSAAHGSKRIKVIACNCVAYDPGVVDLGAAIIVRSDFYTSDGGGAYFAASNACKVADYTLDAAVAYARTTEGVQFSECEFVNFDRFGILNAKDVTLTNVHMPSNYTRGLTCSPSCENVKWIGGTVSGNAAHINANFANKGLIFSNLVAKGEAVVAGQRHTLRCGYGTEDVTFSNITGYGNDTRHVFVEGARNITFDNVTLHNWSGGNTTVAISIAGGHNGNTSSWVTDKIRFIGCSFDSNYSVKFDDNTGTATLADGAVTFDEGCRLNFGVGFVNGTNAPTKYKYYGSGTFVPFLVFSTSGGGVANTYTTQTGWYSIRNGRCFVDGSVTISAKDATGVGNAQISGLPFSSVNTSGRTSALAVSAWSGLTLPANYTAMGAQIGPNTSRLSLLRSGSAGVAAGNIAFSEVGATFAIVFSGEYPIA